MRRWAAIGGALVLATVGTLLLISYVQGAERRAREGQEYTSVLVVTDPIERGTPATEMADSVEPAEIPLDLLADDGVADLADLAGLVATVDLLPGEQLIAARFKTPSDLTSEARIELPDDFLQVTIALDPQRAVGGRLVPGDRVAFLGSFGPFPLESIEPGEADPVVVVGGPEGAASTNLQTPTSTHIVIHKLLVTAIQLEEAVPELVGGASVIGIAPNGTILVTLAATAADVERIVFTAEHGLMWLALEDPDAPEPNTAVVTRERIFR